VGLVGVMLILMAEGGISAQINNNHIQTTLTPEIVIGWLLLLCVFTINLISQTSMSLKNDPEKPLLVIAFIVDIMIIGFIVGIAIALAVLVSEYLQAGHFAWSIDRASGPEEDILLKISIPILMLCFWCLLGIHLYLSKQTIGGIVTNTFIKLNKPDSLIRCIIYGPAVFFSIGTLLLPEYSNKKIEATAYKMSPRGPNKPPHPTVKTADE